LYLFTEVLHMQGRPLCNIRHVCIKIEE
jgi:hypothetical protein